MTENKTLPELPCPTCGTRCTITEIPVEDDEPFKRYVPATPSDNARLALEENKGAIVLIDRLALRIKEAWAIEVNSAEDQRRKNAAFQCVCNCALELMRVSETTIRAALQSGGEIENLKSALIAANEQIEYYEAHCKCMNAVTRPQAEQPRTVVEGLEEVLGKYFTYADGIPRLRTFVSKEEGEEAARIVYQAAREQLKAQEGK